MNTVDSVNTNSIPPLTSVSEPTMQTMQMNHRISEIWTQFLSIFSLNTSGEGSFMASPYVLIGAVVVTFCVAAYALYRILKRPKQLKIGIKFQSCLDKVPDSFISECLEKRIGQKVSYYKSDDKNAIKIGYIHCGERAPSDTYWYNKLPMLNGLDLLAIGTPGNLSHLKFGFLTERKVNWIDIGRYETNGLPQAFYMMVLMSARQKNPIESS